MGKIRRSSLGGYATFNSKMKLLLFISIVTTMTVKKADSEIPVMNRNTIIDYMVGGKGLVPAKWAGGGRRILGKKGYGWYINDEYDFTGKRNPRCGNCQHWCISNFPMEKYGEFWCSTTIGGYICSRYRDSNGHVWYTDKDHPLISFYERYGPRKEGEPALKPDLYPNSPMSKLLHDKCINDGKEIKKAYDSNQAPYPQDASGGAYGKRNDD